MALPTIDQQKPRHPQRRSPIDATSPHSVRVLLFLAAACVAAALASSGNSSPLTFASAAADGEGAAISCSGASDATSGGDLLGSQCRQSNASPATGGRHGRESVTSPKNLAERRAMVRARNAAAYEKKKEGSLPAALSSFFASRPYSGKDAAGGSFDSLQEFMAAHFSRKKEGDGDDDDDDDEDEDGYNSAAPFFGDESGDATDTNADGGAPMKNDGDDAAAMSLYDSTNGFYGRSRAFWRSRPATILGTVDVGNQYAEEGALTPTGQRRQPARPEQRAAFLASLDEEIAASKTFLEALESNTYNPYSRENVGKDFDPARAKQYNFQRITLGRGRALDVGAGIGRTAAALLAPLGFRSIDIVEPAPQLLRAATERLAAIDASAYRSAQLEVAEEGVGPSVLGQAIATRAELLEWPSEPTYDLIHMQWVALHLTDADLIDFLQRAKKALRRNGTAKRRLTAAERDAAAAEGTLPYMRRRLAALGRRGRDVLSDADAREYDKLEDAIEAAEMAEKKKSKQKKTTKSAEKSEKDMYTEISTTGIIFVKELMGRGNSFTADAASGTLIRSRAHFLAIFAAAGLKVHHTAIDSASDGDGRNPIPSYMFSLY